MALSGSVAVKATNQNNLIFSWAATQDIGANTSAIAWQLMLEAGQYGRIDAGPGSPWTATVAGKTFSGTTDLSIGNNERKTLASGQVTVTHDDTGNASFTFSFTQEFWIRFGSDDISTVSGSGSAVLDAIPRISVPTLSASSVELGETVTVYTNRASTALTHKVSWQFGSASGTISSSAGDSCQWSPALELARQIPDAASGTAVIRCATYAGGKKLGTKECTLKLTVPASVVPTASASWEDLSGAYGKMDTLVQGISKLRVDVTGTGAYGSTPVSSSVKLQGKAYSGSILTKSGELQLVVSVTDSRGRSGSEAYPLSVAPYTLPSLTLSASRCTADGTADEAGDHAKITLSGKVTQVNGKNTPSLTLTYGTKTESVSASTGSFSRTKIVAADANDTMAISAVLKDKLASVSRAMTLSTGYATLDFLAGGKGIAFGKAATKEGFECAMPAFFTGPVSGVAPGGFGFGGAMTYIDLTDAAYSGKTLEEALETVLGTMASRSCAQIQFYDTSFHDNKFLGRLWKYTASYATLEAVSYAGYKAVKCKRSGAWNAWEWENPPMQTNVEYRTTQRHFGNPVYVQKFKIGALPQGTNTIEHNLGISANEICRFDAYALKDGDYLYYPIPMVSLNGNISATARVRAAKLDIIAFSDLSAYMGYMNVYYCKN